MATLTLTGLLDFNNLSFAQNNYFLKYNNNACYPRYHLIPIFEIINQEMKVPYL